MAKQDYLKIMISYSLKIALVIFFKIKGILMKKSHTPITSVKMLGQVLALQTGSSSQKEKIEFSRKEIKSKIKKSDYIYAMKNVTVYMGPMCAFCDAAKRLLNRNNIPYKEINIAIEEGKIDEMLSKSNGKKTIPQIFFDDYHVGGYEELRALEKENKLENLLK